MIIKCMHFEFIEFSQKSSDCKGQQLTTIGNRLLDWFSVIMADSKKRHTRNNEKTKGLFLFVLCLTYSLWGGVLLFYLSYSENSSHCFKIKRLYKCFQMNKTKWIEWVFYVFLSLAFKSAGLQVSFWKKKPLETNQNNSFVFK